MSGTAWAADGAPAVRSNQARVAQVMHDLSGNGAKLRAFLQAMPKGGDLHNHLGGSVYAEDFLRWADAENACIAVAGHQLSPPPCGEGQVPARGLAARDAAFYSATVDALSMRNFVPGNAAASGHDQFFSTFAKFGGLGGHRAEGVVVTLEQAARDHVPYVELIANPPQAAALGKRAQTLAWNAKDFAADLAPLQGELPELVSAAREDFATLDAQVRTLMHCGQADASPGCGVRYRYVPYVLRVLPPPVVFGQMVMGYALVQADPERFAAVNIVAPEDNPVALSDYRLHMDMFRFLSTRYPTVPLTLHAGELALGLVPPADLRFHIRDAVDAGARRIGHGVDIGYEDDAAGLMAQMKARHVAVEINLSSNDGILGVKGRDHPLQMYLAAGVPVVLSTDDEGVSRSDMTHEYQRAVQEQGVDYATLKQIARNGLTYAFIPGDSLWNDDGSAPGAACAASLRANAAKPDARCDALLARSEKARMQWQLERDFAAFETQILKGAY
ncbi:adenosine deaminase [Pseudoxanthomonas sp.]|uniref:adenosine deaminase family protein n=1 Tax=Pseudoxanthomonas sp. TaxID=1871049 RepID=UPI002633E0B1|nr:adenosine deaminase [Pseudoxanthomonas sp.]WDS38191.1 MAG: adenosine deaminase [Pseudoxanthomonas sp.]